MPLLYLGKSKVSLRDSLFILCLIHKDQFRTTWRFGWPRDGTQIGLTCTLIILRNYVRDYIHDLDGHCGKFTFRRPIEYDPKAGTFTDIAPSDPPPGTRSRLVALETRLNTLEKQLRDHNQWDSPDVELTHKTPKILEFVKLQRDISILEQIIANTQSPDPPEAYSLLSLYVWKWDPSWKEFYAENDITNTRMYLSFWRSVDDGLPVGHQVFAHVNDMTPEL